MRENEGIWPPRFKFNKFSRSHFFMQKENSIKVKIFDKLLLCKKKILINEGFWIWMFRPDPDPQPCSTAVKSEHSPSPLLTDKVIHEALSPLKHC